MGWRTAALALSALVATASVTLGQNASGPPIPLSETVGKTGGFQVTLAERNPLSAPAEIAKRIKLKPEDAADYDFSKSTFQLYIPAAPGEGGKYGLMVGVVFAANHGFAPAAWRPTLDKYHLIWLGPDNGGDDRPAGERIGEALDEVFNLHKAFAVDDDHVYVSLNANSQTAPAGIGLYYPDVFVGVLGSIQPAWFARL